MRPRTLQVPSFTGAFATGASVLAVALLAACAPEGGAGKPADGVPETAVTVTDAACVPNAITVKAGRNRFVVTNQSMRPLEWEILDGVMVVDERENIVPGLQQTLTTMLKPGTYVMTCGLLTNPRGTLTVTENADAPKAAPTPIEFVSGQAEFKVFVHDRTTRMQREVAAFADALRGGDVAAARAQYAPSRAAWQELAPVAQLVSESFDRLDGQASLYKGGASDPAFTGWHRIEALLFADDAAAHAAQLSTLADTLQKDTDTFVTTLRAAKIDVAAIFRGASLAARRIAERKLTGLDNAASGADVSDALANVAGLRRIVDIFAGALGTHAPDSLTAMRASLDRLQAGLAPAATGAPVTDAKALVPDATALADEFETARGTLGH